MKKSKAAVIPVGIELPIDMLTPIHIYNAIDKAGYKKKFILESADGGEDVGRYSYIGFSPVNEIKVRKYKLEFKDSLKDKLNNMILVLISWMKFSVNIKLQAIVAFLM